MERERQRKREAAEQLRERERELKKEKGGELERTDMAERTIKYTNEKTETKEVKEKF